MVSLKKLTKKIVYGTLAFGGWSILSLSLWDGFATPWYRVKTQHSVVITEVDGEKRIKDNPGIHLRIDSWDPRNWVASVKEFSKRVEYINLDGNPQPHEMQAADKIKFQGSGVWTYQVIDLNKFGIEMGEEVKQMLARELNGIAKAKIQNHNIETIVTKLDMINKEVVESNDVKNIEKKYGIKIHSFKMTHAMYPHEMNEKTAQAKGEKILAEAWKQAANDKAAAINILSAAYGKYLEELKKGAGVETEAGKQKVLEILANLELYRMLGKRPPGDTFVIMPGNNGKNPTVTLPNPKKNKKKDNSVKQRNYPSYSSAEDEDDYL